MKTIKDYHIHSTYSRNNHGKSTIEEIVQWAVEHNIKEIAITDHGCSHFLSMWNVYGIRKNKIVEAKNKIKEIRKKYPQIKILFGIEANILSLDGDTDINEDIVENCDIILCGYHAGVRYSSFKDAWNFCAMNFVGKIIPQIREKQREKNTDAVIKALERHNINILTHPGDKIPFNIDRIGRAAEENNTILEINNHHSHLNAEEIRIVSKYDIKFVIGSDAHRKEDIGGCQKAIKAAKEAGLNLKRIVNLDIEDK